MLQAIKKLFDETINPEKKDSKEVTEHRLQLATAALLVEMMRMNQQIKAVELEAVTRAIKSKFALSESEIADLLQLAQEEAEQATDYYQFTTLINRGFTPEQKVRVVEHMWQVAYADQELDQYEEHLVRKIADLLYVPHRDYIAAKIRVKTQVFGATE